MKSSFQRSAEKMRGNDQPRHEHDCNRCPYLGNLNQFDLYVCVGFNEIGEPSTPLRSACFILRGGPQGDYRTTDVARMLQDVFNNADECNPGEDLREFFKRLWNAGFFKYMYSDPELHWAADREIEKDSIFDLVIPNVDYSMLEKQRAALASITYAAENGLFAGAADIELIGGLQNMLDEWSDNNMVAYHKRVDEIENFLEDYND